MASFDKYAPILKKWEGYGVFVNHLLDPGGATMNGVTLRTFKLYYGRDKTVEDLKRMTDYQWRYIMKTGYWDKCKADKIKNQSVANIFVDWCVNSGTGMIKKVQAILGLKADGIVGPKTLSAINNGVQPIIHMDIKNARKAYYDGLVAQKPSQKVFYKGWMNRLNSFTYMP